MRLLPNSKYSQLNPFWKYFIFCFPRFCRVISLVGKAPTQIPKSGYGSWQWSPPPFLIHLFDFSIQNTEKMFLYVLYNLQETNNYSGTCLIRSHPLLVIIFPISYSLQLYLQMIGYCYHSVNVIRLSLSQSKHIKWHSLKLKATFINWMVNFKMCVPWLATFIWRWVYILRCLWASCKFYVIQ